MCRDNASREQAAREAGLEEGREEERTAIARKLLGKGHPVDEVMDTTGLSIEQVQSLLH
jgi:predicted transposase/invertase (TIGR01784 family)